MRKATLAVLGIAAAVAGGLVWSHLPRQPRQGLAADGPPVQDEETAIAASRGLVWRDGTALNLRLKGGEILTLTDRLTCGDLPCPRDLAIQYRYGGWQGGLDGYLLSVTPAPAPKMVLPFADDDPVLVDARHAIPAETAMPLPPLPPTTQADESLNDWLTDVANGRAQSEAPRLAASDGQAWRDGPRLTLTLADHRRLTLSDDLACGQVSCPPQVFRSFDYAGRSPDGRFHVVEERRDEVSAALLIDRQSGGITTLLGLPKFSPDGQRAVATVTDLEWSAPRRLEVWTLAGAAPGMEFSLTARDEDEVVYEVVDWADGEHVRLRRGTWASEQRSDAMLVHDKAGWHIEGSDGGER